MHQPAAPTMSATFVGEVVTVQRLAPRMVRVVLGGAGLEGFEPVPYTDQYLSAFFPPDGAPYTVPFDLEQVRRAHPEHRPARRRYTVRRWDGEARRLTVDFVVHGDVGAAGRWANHAAPGDLLQVSGPAGGYRPDPTADAHLMVGDESALPAIGASLEAVAPGQRVLVVVVVDGPGHEIELTSPGDLAMRWVHRSDAPGDPDRLLAAVAALDLPAGRVVPFVHGEAAEVRAIRRHLLADRGLSAEGASISPYWRRGLTDEGWREIKAAWLAAADAEV